MKSAFHTGVKEITIRETPVPTPGPGEYLVRIKACAICGSTDTYLDEVILDDQGNRMFVCSDTDCCARRAAVRDGQRGAQ